MNTCEWAIQGRLVHCHHIGESHDHPPHSPNLSQSTREAIIENHHAWKCGIGFIGFSLCVCLCFSPIATVHFQNLVCCIISTTNVSGHSCLSGRGQKVVNLHVCCCLTRPSFKSVWHLCSPYKWLLLGVLPTSKKKRGLLRPHWWEVSALVCWLCLFDAPVAVLFGGKNGYWLNVKDQKQINTTEIFSATMFNALNFYFLNMWSWLVKQIGWHFGKYSNNIKKMTYQCQCRATLNSFSFCIK